MPEHRDKNADAHAKAFADRQAAFNHGVEDYVLHGKRKTFEDLAPGPGPFDKYQSSVWNTKRGQSDKFLHSIDGWNGDGTGWMDSATRTVAPSNGFKDISVTGTVTGQAELLQNLRIDAKPTVYFESLVKQAESVANRQLGGQLGTGFHGPGDNSVKSSQSPALGTQ